jgi:hypothetical protein
MLASEQPLLQSRRFFRQELRARHPAGQETQAVRFGLDELGPFD